MRQIFYTRLRNKTMITLEFKLKCESDNFKTQPLENSSIWPHTHSLLRAFWCQSFQLIEEYLW